MILSPPAIINPAPINPVIVPPGIIVPGSGGLSTCALCWHPKKRP